MTPRVDHPPEEETEMLLLAAERRRRRARATLRRRLYLATIVALVATTTALGIVNLNVGHQAATAQSQPPAIDTTAPVTPAPPSPAPMAEPKSEPAVEPEPATPKPPSVAPRPPIKRDRDPARTIIVKGESAPPKPPLVAPKPAAAYIDAKSDPAIVKPPIVTSPASPQPEPPKVVQPREPAPPIFHKPAERHRDVESAQAPADATGRVAHWMAETYGKRGAELRAELAMTLYPANDDRAEHWRKVLDHLRETN